MEGDKGQKGIANFEGGQGRKVPVFKTIANNFHYFSTWQGEQGDVGEKGRLGSKGVVGDKV